jgi:hypothetical protein
MNGQRVRHASTRGAVFSVFSVVALVASACQSAPDPSTAAAATSVATAAPTVGTATAAKTAAATALPAERFVTIGKGDLPENGPIVFFHTNDARTSNSPYEIATSGFNEHQLRDGGLLPGVWSPDGKQLAVRHLVKDPSPKPGAEAAWLRPAIVNADGSGWRALDPAAGRKMHLAPIGWAADGSNVLMDSGGEDVDAADMGLWSMRASDGGELTHLYTTPQGHNEGFLPSPDRSKLLVTTSTNDLDRALFVINADGSGRVNITDATLNPAELEFYGGVSADWSPDGSHIVFGAQRTDGVGDPPALYVALADGTARREIVSAAIGAVSARWSPAGNLIAFTSKLRAGGQVWIVQPDGTGMRQLTDAAGDATSVVPMWSPDGSALLFERQVGGEVALWTMQADGTSQRQLTRTPIAAEYVGDYTWWPAIRP